MKKAIFFFLFFFFCKGFLFSQSDKFIQGIVTNELNGSPVPYASVFLSNTSKGTAANENGEFELQSIPDGKYQLVVSCIGYQTNTFSFTSTQLPLKLKISLNPKSGLLTAVTVEPYEKNGWRRWGKIFLNDFIGNVNSNDRCSIQNTKSLHFWFSKKTNRLIVRADEPLIIENEALGYTIKYQLEEFYHDYNLNEMLYLGYPFFQQKTGSPKKMAKWKSERQKVYSGSLMHFMRCLYVNKLKENRFQMVRTFKTMNAEKLRIKKIYKNIISLADSIELDNEMIENVDSRKIFPSDSVRYYKSVFDQPDYHLQNIEVNRDSILRVDKDTVRILFFVGILDINYSSDPKKKQFYSSDISLITPLPVRIEKNGFYSPAQEILSNGYWGQLGKIANALPLDYSPDE